MFETVFVWRNVVYDVFSQVVWGQCAVVTLSGETDDVGWQTISGPFSPMY